MPFTYIFKRTLSFQRKLAPVLHFKRTHGAGWKNEGVCAPVECEVSVLPWLRDFILKSEKKKPLCQSLQLMLLRLSSGDILTTKDERKEKILHDEDEEPKCQVISSDGSVWDFFPFWSEEFLIL